jgi:CBS domain-containing protein
MRVQDVMTTDVETVAPDAPLKEVAGRLVALGISGLPVVDRDQVVGVVSEADILVKERGTNPDSPGILGLLHHGGVETEAKLHARTAGDAMTSPAVTIAPMRPVAEAAATMIDKRVNRLPVVDEDGALVGIVTRADLVRAFVRSDEEIAREIREDVVLQTLWIPPDQVNVRVKDGEVELTGCLDTQADTELVVSRTKSVPGVVGVSSDLTWRS